MKERREESLQSQARLKGFLQATRYLDSHLNNGEVPIYRAHLSWIPLCIHQIPFMLIGGVTGGLAWTISNSFITGSSITLMILIIGILSQLPQAYRNFTTDILLTNQGIHSKTKLIAVKDDQFTRHAYINDAELNYDTIWKRIFKYGDVDVTTLAGCDDSYHFDNLARPMLFKNAVREAQQKYSAGSNPVPTPAPSSYDARTIKRGDNARRRQRPRASSPHPRR